MAVVGRSFLLAVGWALGAVYIQDDAVRRLAAVHPVIQTPDKSVRAAGVPSATSYSFSNRPIWLVEAVGRSIPSRPTMAQHGAVAGEPLSVVDVLIVGEKTVNRLPRQTEQPVASLSRRLNATRRGRGLLSPITPAIAHLLDCLHVADQISTISAMGRLQVAVSGKYGLKKKGRRIRPEL